MTNPHEQMQAQRKRITELVESIRALDGVEARAHEPERPPTLLARLRAWLKGWRK